MASKSVEDSMREGLKSQQHTAMLMTSVDLHAVLGNSKPPPLDRDTFHEFCKEEFSEENIDFWVAVDCYKRSHTLSQAELARMARMIWEEWAKAGSSYEVNLPSNCRKSTLADLEKVFPRFKDTAPADKSELFMITSPLAPRPEGLEDDVDIEMAESKEDPNPATLEMRSVFNQAHEEIYRLMAKDTFPRFIKLVTVQKNLALSVNNALWWRNKDLTLKEFFSFPNPVNNAESRLHNLMAFTLVITALLLDKYYDFYYLYFWVLYGYIVRVISGPRLSPNSYIVLFLLRPLFVTKLKLFKDKFKPSPPKRFAQLCGVFFATVGCFFRFIIKIPIISLIAWCGIIFAGSVAFFVDWCVGCFTFEMLMKLGLVPKDVVVQCGIQYM